MLASAFLRGLQSDAPDRSPQELSKSFSSFSVTGTKRYCLPTL